jgi:hypothetical protein
MAKIEGIVKEACKAVGMAERNLLASRVYDDGRVVLVTIDGRKIEWRKPEKPEAGEK